MPISQKLIKILPPLTNPMKTKSVSSRKPRAAPDFRKVSVAEAKTQLPALLRGRNRTIIFRHGTPAGVLIPFENADDFADWIFDNSPTFRKKLEAIFERGMKEYEEGKTIPFEEATRQMGL